MEIGRLSRDPVQESLDIRSRFERLEIRIGRGKIVVGNARVDNAVADRMNRQDFGSTKAFGDTVVPLDLAPQHAVTKAAPLEVAGKMRSCLGLFQPGHPLHSSAHAAKMVIGENAAKPL